MSKKSRKNAKGEYEVLCGGYVSYGPDHNRRSKEVRVWMPAGKDYADCGENTNALVAALKAAVGDRKNIECGECWQY